MPSKMLATSNLSSSNPVVDEEVKPISPPPRKEEEEEEPISPPQPLKREIWQEKARDGDGSVRLEIEEIAAGDRRHETRKRKNHLGARAPIASRIPSPSFTTAHPRRDVHAPCRWWWWQRRPPQWRKRQARGGARRRQRRRRPSLAPASSPPCSLVAALLSFPPVGWRRWPAQNPREKSERDREREEKGREERKERVG
uniref:Uncharacterized protein n=1 Tax=Oryza nivara TaxID=4536 RepID=A0A0E0GAZ3_ORYNI